MICRREELFVVIFRWLAAVMLLEAFAHVACGAEACGVGNLRDAHLPFGDKGSRLSQTDIAYEDAWRFVEERRQFTVKSGAIHAEIRTETRVSRFRSTVSIARVTKSRSSSDSSDSPVTD